MSDPTCPSCGASFGPEVSLPRPGDSGSFRPKRPCPACGWQPPPPTEEKPKKRSEKGKPRPPKAGKSFTGDKR